MRFKAPAGFVSSAGVVGMLAVSALAVGTTPASAAEACPNEQFRTGYSAGLPDCRAYELVSPPGVQPYFQTFGQGQTGETTENSLFNRTIVGSEDGSVASVSSTGSGIAFFSTFAPPGSTSDGPFYLSARGAGGWSTQNVVPPQSTEDSPACLPYMVAWSGDLQRGVLADGYQSRANNCGQDEPELVPGEPHGVQNLFVRDNISGTYQLVNKKQTSAAISPAPAYFQTGSSDLSLVVFDEEAPLVEGAPILKAGTTKPEPVDDFYVWSGGSEDRLLTILPDGAPVEGELADATIQSEEHTSPPRSSRLTNPTFTRAVAPDGSRAVFVAGGALYVRERPGEAQSAFNGEGHCEEPTKACTVQVDASETAEPGGAGLFDGTSGESADVVYFTDARRLTSDSTAEPGGPDLYEYDFRRPVGSRLIDLTVDHQAGEHADVLGFVGSNETGPAGEYAYFVARGVLADNENASHAVAVAGSPNLYEAHSGAVTFVARLDSTILAATNEEADSCDWESECLTARVSANGLYLGFDSLAALTGADNIDVNTGGLAQDIFLYSAASQRLTCASCGTSRQPPTAPASIRVPEGLFAFPTVPKYAQRNVSDSGQVFFDTANPLLPGARDGLSNVYEYENEQLHLLSSGTSEAPSYFYDASVNGNDAYLINAQSLVSGASSAELAVYDAKIGGGFPAASESPNPCSGETCSGPQGAAPLSPSISSESLSGQGNLEPATPFKPTVRSLTNAQKLAKALKACRVKRDKHKRAVCESQGRRKYGTKTKSAKSNRRGKR